MAVAAKHPPPAPFRGTSGEAGGGGLIRFPLPQYTSVASETACGCAPSSQHSRISSDAMTHPPARDHRPPRSISGHQKGAGAVCFTAISANTPLSFLGGDILHLYHAQEHTPHPCRNKVSAHTQNKRNPTPTPPGPSRKETNSRQRSFSFSSANARIG